MKVLIQRVSEATVQADGNLLGSVGRGYLLFVGIEKGDGEKELIQMARKVLKLRLFADKGKEGRKSISDIQGEILVVSQFTLCADVGKGTRPSFSNALEPELASKRVERWIEILRQSGLKVESGRFGARMQVSLVNNGPYTIWLESNKSRKNSEEAGES